MAFLNEDQLPNIPADSFESFFSGQILRINDTVLEHATLDQLLVTYGDSFPALRAPVLVSVLNTYGNSLLDNWTRINAVDIETVIGKF